MLRTSISHILTEKSSCTTLLEVVTHMQVVKLQMECCSSTSFVHIVLGMRRKAEESWLPAAFRHIVAAAESGPADTNASGGKAAFYIRLFKPYC